MEQRSSPGAAGSQHLEETATHLRVLRWNENSSAFIFFFSHHLFLSISVELFYLLGIFFFQVFFFFFKSFSPLYFHLCRDSAISTEARSLVGAVDRRTGLGPISAELATSPPRTPSSTSSTHSPVCRAALGGMFPAPVNEPDSTYSVTLAEWRTLFFRYISFSFSR